MGENSSKLGVEFLKLIKAYSKEEQKVLVLAQRFASSKLGGIERLSKGSIYDHNIRSAISLLKINFASEVVIATILYGSLKHKVSEREVFEEFGKEEFGGERFGKEILDLVKGASSITFLKKRNKKLQAETLRKILLTTLKDPRMLFVKFATKIDNLQHIEVLEVSERKRIAQEVLDVYAPLAYRLGVEKLRVQLEDEAFRILHPCECKTIENFLLASSEERQVLIDELMKEISSHCPVKIVKIKGRTKHLYSIYKKQVERGVKLEEQYDHLALRVVVDSKESCYVVLGFLHEKYETVPGRLKDYIANSKPNGYQSIHTVIVLDGKKVEVQIRTQKMDEVAEEGVAAHWMYKRGKKEGSNGRGIGSQVMFEKRMGWLKGILDLQKDADSKEFLENVKVDLFTDEIYVYTPKGDVRYLAKGSYILDFAYSVHEQVGNTAVGARINGKFVPLRTKLSQEDVVEIVTSKNQRPRQSWLKIVRSSKAKQKIRKSLKEHENVPALHYTQFKKIVSEEHDTLAMCPDFENAACILAKCCQPIPGNKVVGVATKRRLISVHKEECREAQKMKNRWLLVSWKETFNKPLQLHVQASERSGLLADLLNTIARAAFTVKEAKAKFIGTGTTLCGFVVVPRELEELERLLEIIFKVKGVKKIYFE